MLVGVVVLLLLLLFFVRRTPLPSHTPITILDSVLSLRTPIRADSNSSRNPRHRRPPPPTAREEALSHEDSHALTTRPDRRATEREGGCSYSTSRPRSQGARENEPGIIDVAESDSKSSASYARLTETEYRGETVTNWGCSTSEPVRRMGTGDRLLDIPCKVCDDRSSGKHYGIYSCDGCSGFFKRSIHSKRKYTCKAHGSMTGRCPIDKIHRNQCRACRLNKCFHVGMNRDAVQHERGPRKPKLHSVMPDKLHHQQQQQPIVAQLSPHSGTTGHPDVSRVDFNSNLLSHHRSVVSQLSPLSGTTVHHDGPRVDISSHLLSHHRRLRCPQRTAPYPQPVSLMQKPPDESPSPVPLPLQFPPPNASLYHSATFAFGQQPPPLLQILMSAEKYQEFVWKSQPDGEGSLDQTETEASHSPTGILQSLVPTWEVLQETTARLLFMAVRWVRCLAPFQTLSKDDQLLLLQQTWTQLFLLHLAQWSITRDISGLLEDDQVRRRLPPEQRYRDEIVTIQEIMARFRQLSPDGGECGSMKAVILFTPETRGLSNPKPVEMLQDQAQCILGDYIRSRYPRQPARFGRFLLLLPSLQAVKPSTVELLFFRATIGEIPIARLLGDMYQMEHHHADVTLSFCNRFQESSEHERDLQSEKTRG